MRFSLSQTKSTRQRLLLLPGILFWALGSLTYSGWVSAEAGALADAEAYFAGKSTSAKINQIKKAGTAATVDLNTATAEQLAAVLNGVGASKAKAIVRYRTEIGPFRDIQELEEVKGIGPRIVAFNQGRITLSKAKR